MSGASIFIESCPFCGTYDQEELCVSTISRLTGTALEYNTTRVACSCGAMGPDADNHRDAVYRWNERKEKV